MTEKYMLRLDARAYERQIRSFLEGVMIKVKSPDASERDLVMAVTALSDAARALDAAFVSEPGQSMRGKP